RNTGARNMVISEISVTGSAAADFAVVAVLPIPVAPGTSFAIPVTFGPRAVGTRTATLALSDNAAGSREFWRPECRRDQRRESGYRRKYRYRQPGHLQAEHHESGRRH